MSCSNPSSVALRAVQTSMSFSPGESLQRDGQSKGSLADCSTQLDQWLQSYVYELSLLEQVTNANVIVE